MQRLSQAVVVAVMVLFAQSASATLYDFMWSGNSFSATGTLELSNAVGIGASFDKSDVLSFQVELFDGAVSVAMDSFPPFDDFDALKGTRNPSSLSINDLIVSEPGIFFGCDAGDCLSGRVAFGTPSTSGAKVDFGSIAAARASFVFTEVPEPGAESLLAAALVTIAGLRFSTSRSRS